MEANALPHDFVALAAVVFLLGLKHGFDADHLATIDGLTRYNARGNAKLARMCGTLFSLGHGCVVVLVALIVSSMASVWHVPAWLESFGTWFSILFLLGIGVVNIAAVLRTRPNEMVKPIGLRTGPLGFIFNRFSQISHPLSIMGVGALFALSFDTMSQAALFALTASQYGGWQSALVLSGLFLLGMLITDGINGFWISRLIQRSDEMACVASRVMSLAVSGVSLLVASFGIAKACSSMVSDWSEGKELAFGALVVAIVLLSFLAGRWLAQTQAKSNLRVETSRA